MRLHSVSDVRVNTIVTKGVPVAGATRPSRAFLGHLLENLSTRKEVSEFVEAGPSHVRTKGNQSGFDAQKYSQVKNSMHCNKFLLSINNICFGPRSSDMTAAGSGQPDEKAFVNG